MKHGVVSGEATLSAENSGNLWAVGGAHSAPPRLPSWWEGACCSSPLSTFGLDFDPSVLPHERFLGTPLEPLYSEHIEFPRPPPRSCGGSTLKISSGKRESYVLLQNPQLYEYTQCASILTAIF